VSIGGRVNIWDLTKEPIAGPRTVTYKTENQNEAIATALCFSPDSKRLLVATPWLRAFDVYTATEVKILNINSIEVFFGTSPIDFSRNADHFAVANDSGVK
jgi:WD40 repeat protein